MKKVTVGELMDSLSRFDRNDPIEVKIEQYNKKSPVAYCQPVPSGRMYDALATKEDGITVRLAVNLPYGPKTFMVTSTRKIQ